MKLIKYLFVTSLCATILNSCSRDFLETEPSTAIGEVIAENTEQGLDGILQGIHYMTYSYNWGDAHYFGVGQESLGAQLDMMGDDMINTLPGYFMGVYRYQDHINPNGKINYKAWDFYYTIILHANKLIEGANKIDLIPTKKATLLGEAYAYRAWAYHNLVQLFAKRYVKGSANEQLGVILRTPDNTIDPLPRSTVAEVYQFIDNDIKAALDYLSKAPDKNIKNSIRYSTACGIAARIALSKSEWKDAETYAQEAISKSGASLQSGVALNDGFNNYNASEWMWGYTQGPTQDFKYYSFYADYSYNFIGYNKGLRYAVNRSLYDKMGEKDVRRNWWVCLDRGDNIPKDANPDYFQGGTVNPRWEVTGQSVKWKAEGPNNSRGDMLIMRLAEMYYIKAEAQARQNNYGAAKATLNTIMLTRDPEYTTTASGNALIEEIMRNKRIDLWMEGQRFFDMKRLGELPKRAEAKNFDYLSSTQKQSALLRNTGTSAKNIPTTEDSKYWQFAIPYAELKGNPLCKQNDL